MTNWNRLARTVAPTGDILDTDTVGAHVRDTSGDNDDYFSALIATATAFLEGPFGAGIALLTQTWRLSLDCLDQRGITIPLGPVQEVLSVTYTDMGGSSEILDPSLYVVDYDASPCRITRAYGATFPVPVPQAGCVKVTFTCGYGDTADTIPADILHAAKLLIGHWNENREAVVGIGSRDSPMDMPLGVDAILNKYRIAPFG